MEALNKRLCTQVDGQRVALHLAHTRQFDQEMAKLIDANMMNCTPVMQQQRSMKRPIKPLRKLPERYKYLMQKGEGVDPAIHPACISKQSWKQSTCYRSLGLGALHRGCRWA